MNLPGYSTTRRGLVLGAGSLPLVLTACGEEDVPDLPVETPTPAPTQAEPTPTMEAVASPVSGYLDPNRWEGRTLRVATAGVADFLDDLTECFFDAFEQDTGASVEHLSLNREGIEGVQSQVESGNIEWDVVLMPSNQVLELSNLGVWPRLIMMLLWETTCILR